MSDNGTPPYGPGWRPVDPTNHDPWSQPGSAQGPLVPYSPPPGPGLPGYPPQYRPPLDHPSGATVLVLGILSLVLCPVTGIFAITMGNRALREIDANPYAYANRQSVAIGRILGIVAVAIYGAAIVGYLFFLVVIVGAVGLSSQ